MNRATPDIVYRYGEGLYVNITNRCPTACAFCIKRTWKMGYRGYNLDLAGQEPSPEKIAALASAAYGEKKFSELVFCGYGEPTMRLPELLETARLIRTGAASPVPPGIRIRLNTNGLASLVWGRDVVPEMKGLIDSVHISVNATAAGAWKEIMRPLGPYAEGGFESVKEFTRRAAELLPEAVATTIAESGKEISDFRKMAAELGAQVRVRPRLEDGALP